MKRKADDRAPKTTKRLKIDTEPPGEDTSSGRTSDVLTLADILPAGLGKPVRDYVQGRALRLVERLNSQDEDEDERILRRLAAYALHGRDEYPLGRTESPGVRPPLTAAAVEEAMKRIAASDEFRTPAPRAGAWQKTGVLLGPVSKATVRDLQLLNHLSQALINHVGRPVKDVPGTGTAEIEAMAVNGRILVSANERTTVTTLLGYNLTEVLTWTGKGVHDDWTARKADKLDDLMIALASKDLPDPFDAESEEAAGIGRLVQLQVDCTMEPVQAEAVKTILAVLHQVMTVKGADRIVDGKTPGQDPDLIKRLITDDEHAGRIIVVNGQSGTQLKAHAEQNLLHAAILAGHKGKSSVAGGKRPCTVCWATLRLARDYGYDVSFNPRPGGLWSSTTSQGLHKVAKELGLVNVFEFVQGLITGNTLDPGLVQHATATSMTAEPATTVGLRETVTKSTLANRDALTHSESDSLDSQSPSSSQSAAEKDAPVELEEDRRDVFLDVLVAEPEEKTIEIDPQ
ncbi:hypothetical protein KNE206_42230 [Kitasatospora sp. NE20-6]|uniref:hypothetical protein n=1 Tax=Kitasatospora sp. NE20-6 TaxID=2859066 RepID=UPI0034DB8FCE